MSRRLVTVATYDLPPIAHIARNALEAAGIKAIISDDQMVGMDWLLSTALGGVKVQVWEEDVERAVVVLEAAAGAPEEGSESAEGEDEEDNGYEPTEEDFADEPETDPMPVSVTGEVAVSNDPPSRDRLARRAFFTAWLGLVLLPVAAYSFYLCLNGTFEAGPISGRGKFELGIAWLTSCLGFFFSTMICLSVW